MISNKNKIIHIKVSNEVYSFMKIFSKKFDVSISQLGQHLISVGITMIDKEQEKNKFFYEALSETLKKYDYRRKIWL